MTQTPELGALARTPIRYGPIGSAPQRDELRSDLPSPGGRNPGAPQATLNHHADPEKACRRLTRKSAGTARNR